MSDAKRRRRDSAELLRRLASVRGVTSTALSDILKTLKAAPAGVSASGRTTIGYALNDQFDEFSHVEICTLDDGSEFRWQMIDPSRLLSEVVRRNRTVAAAYWVLEGSLAVRLKRIAGACPEHQFAPQRSPGNKF